MPPQNDAPSHAFSEFSMFAQLPQELQAAIFDEARPKVQSQHIFFMITMSWDLRTTVNHSCHLIPLLTACKTSRKTVLRRLKQINILIPRNILPASWKIEEEWVPAPRTERDMLHFIDPRRDIVMFNFAQLERLHLRGPKVDLAGITRLGLGCSDIGSDIETWNLVEGSALMVPQSLPKMLDFVYSSCVDLKELKIIMNRIDGLWATKYFDTVKLIDVSREFLRTNHQDYEIPDRSSFNHLIDHQLGRRKLLEKLETEMKVVEEYLSSHKNPEFWAKVNISWSLVACYVEDGWWDTHDTDLVSPSVYIRSLGLAIEAHNDGTLLDRYKGIAQIFGDAPWDTGDYSLS